MAPSLPVVISLLGACSGFAPAGSPELALARWVESEGGFIAGALSAETRGGVRGLYVREPVAAGCLLASVPRACVITAVDDPKWGLTLAELLAARLVGAITRGECAAYTAALPASEPLLCDWSDAELARLDAPHVVAAAEGMRPFLDASEARVLPFVEADAAAVAAAARAVRSRALVFARDWENAPGPDGLPRRAMCLVPVVDLANHRTPALRGRADAPSREPVALSDDGGGAVTLTAAADLAAGDEVTITYRYEGNAQLLLDYGFAEVLSPDAQPSFEPLALRAPAVAPPGADGAPLVLGTDDADAPALAALRARLAGEPEPDRAVCEALARACEDELAARATTEAEDLDALESLAASRPADVADAGRWRSILAFRLAQKARLRRTARALSELLRSPGAIGLSEVRGVLLALRSEVREEALVGL